MNIYEKLSAVQQELKAPKDKKNTFAGYNYRSAEGILEAVKPVLKKYGLTLILSDDIEVKGDRYYVRATAWVLDPDDKADFKVTAYAREAVDKKGLDVSQVTGTASSYARKYALNGLFLIDDTADPDSDEYQKQTGATKEAQKQEKTADPRENEIIDQKTVDLIEKMAKDADVNLSGISTKPLKDFTNKQAGALIQSLKRRIEAKEGQK